MKFTAAALALLASTALNTAQATEGTTALGGIAKMNHVFVIMMENHGYSEVVGNPEMPYFNNVLIPAGNLATNYYAVAHPSLTNYLEVIGGSNFGINDDNSPTYTQAPACTSTLVNPTNESTGINNCAIAGTGYDAATPAYDCSNEVTGNPANLATCDVEIDGVDSYGAAPTTGKSIGDQLNAVNMTWKTYQESLPSTGPWGVTTGDGQFTDIATPTADEVAAGETYNKIGKLYRTKHNPFMYFASVQAGYDKATGKVAGIASYEGTDGLWADLATGHVANYTFIAPNQCHDQHGGTSSGLSYPWCAGDPADQGGLTGLNPGLMQAGDIQLKDLVTGIESSPAWGHGHNAIVIVWDENDYTQNFYSNKVPLLVLKNYGTKGVQSNKYYTSFSLLKTTEAAFGLPCLNHACDTTTSFMGDLFR